MIGPHVSIAWGPIMICVAILPAQRGQQKNFYHIQGPYPPPYPYPPPPP